MLLPQIVTGQEDDAAPGSGAAKLAESNPGFLAEVVKRLSPESRQEFGEMLRQDWQNPPEWVEMLIAILTGEDLGAGHGWFKPSQLKYTWDWLADKFDSDGDGTVVADELTRQVPGLESLFARLDRDNDGRLRAPDFDYSARQPPSPHQTFAQMMSYILDTDSNGRVTADELQDFLERADKERAGFITSEDLLTNFSQAFAERSALSADSPEPEEVLSMFFRGEVGLWEAGPRLGDEAPDFTLPTHDGSQSVTLSQSRGKPVILVFGSFT